MSYKRKNFGILGGEAKGGASIRLYSYLLDKEETFNDLLATGYFNEERERLLPNDLIKVLMPDKDFKLGYLMVKRVTLDNVELIKVEIDAKSDLLPLPDSDNGSTGTSDLISRYDHQHPKVIATETERGQIIIASEEETLQGVNNTKAITPLKNKLYFDNQQAISEEINNGNDVKKYINPLQIKTIKDELQENINNNTNLINNNTTLINTNKQELDEDISSINQDIVDVNSQIQGINTNKANVSLDNINTEGQNVIKDIISDTAFLLDGSNFNSLNDTAKYNILSSVLGGLQTTDQTKVGYILLFKDNDTTPTNSKYTLPEGGTWFVNISCVATNGTFLGTGSGGRIVAGGTSITVDSRASGIFGFAIKIQ